MKNQRIFSLVFLIAGMVVGLAGQLHAQQPNTVQSASPSIQMPASTLPVNLDPEAGNKAVQSTTSNAIGGSQPVESTLPNTGGSMQAADAEIKDAQRTISPADGQGAPAPHFPAETNWPLSPAEIEELKDGK